MPSTLFISLTDCSSPNPRAAAAVPAPRSPKDAGGRRRGEEPSTSREIRLCKANRASHNATSGPRNRHTRVLPTPFGKNSKSWYPKIQLQEQHWGWGILHRNQGRASNEIHFTNAPGEKGMELLKGTPETNDNSLCKGERIVRGIT